MNSSNSSITPKGLVSNYENQSIVASRNNYLSVSLSLRFVIFSINEMKLNRAVPLEEINMFVSKQKKFAFPQQSESDTYKVPLLFTTETALPLSSSNFIMSFSLQLYKLLL